MPGTRHIGWLRYLVVGSLSTLVGFFAALMLSTIFAEQYFTLLVASVAFSCWYANWKAGVVSAFIGIFAVILLLPPILSFQVDSKSDIIRIFIYIFTGSMVCTLSYLNDKNRERFIANRVRTALSQEVLVAAAEDARMWTWVFDQDRRLISWQKLTGDHKARMVMTFDSWLMRMHPGDREKLRSILDVPGGPSRFNFDYRVQTRKGIYWWRSRGVALQQYGPGSPKLIGISTDIDKTKQPSSEPLASVPPRTEIKMSALIEIDALIYEVISSTSLHASYRNKLIEARQKVEKLLVTDLTSRV